MFLFGLLLLGIVWHRFFLTFHLLHLWSTRVCHVVLRNAVAHFY